MNSLTICFVTSLTIRLSSPEWPRLPDCCAEVTDLCLGGEPGELCATRRHLLGRRQLEHVEDGADAVDPVVPERGFPDVPPLDRGKPRGIGVEVGEDAGDVG